MTLMKKSIDDNAYRSSCRATNGHRTQFTGIGAIVPTTNTVPLSTVSKAGDVSLSAPLT